MKKILILLLFVVVTSCHKDDNINLLVYPNPVVDYLTIDYKVSNSYVLIMTDSQNNEYYRNVIDNKKGKLVIDMSGFEKKFYYIKIIDNKSTLIQIKKM